MKLTEPEKNFLDCAHALMASADQIRCLNGALLPLYDHVRSMAAHVPQLPDYTPPEVHFPEMQKTGGPLT